MAGSIAARRSRLVGNVGQADVLGLRRAPDQMVVPILEARQHQRAGRQFVDLGALEETGSTSASVPTAAILPSTSAIACASGLASSMVSTRAPRSMMVSA